MARPLRMEFVGGLYHPICRGVICRGNQRNPIVHDHADREKRLDWLRRTVQKLARRIH